MSSLETREARQRKMSEDYANRLRDIGFFTNKIYEGPNARKPSDVNGRPY